MPRRQRLAHLQACLELTGLGFGHAVALRGGARAYHVLRRQRLAHLHAHLGPGVLGFKILAQGMH